MSWLLKQIFAMFWNHFWVVMSCTLYIIQLLFAFVPIISTLLCKYGSNVNINFIESRSCPQNGCYFLQLVSGTCSIKEIQWKYETMGWSYQLESTVNVLTCNCRDLKSTIFPMAVWMHFKHFMAAQICMMLMVALFLNITWLTVCNHN